MQKIDFEPDLSFNRATQQWEFMYRPYLFVKLINRKRSSGNVIKTLVDSGSDHNIFPAEFATEIGLNYKKGTKRETTAVNEYAFVVYGNRVKVEYDGKTFETIIYFGDNVKIPVLGRNGFFNYYRKVSFDVKNKVFELLELR